jgi:hypothetical protein
MKTCRISQEQTAVILIGSFILYIETDLINALPGSSSVNTVQRATIDEDVFFVVSAE